MHIRLHIIILTLLCIGGALFALSLRAPAEKITYGASFSKLHADELKLDWKETYLAILDDLGVRHLRLSAHWPMIEPRNDEFHFEELDYQMDEAARRGAVVVLAVGRRLPGWPECHDPLWTTDLSVSKRQEEQLSYMTAVVERYKNAPNLKYWQVENEPFLYFAPQYCGAFDEEFFKKELDLVRSLDAKHPVLVTDSGEAGKWYKAKHYGDVFGTSLYLYVYYEHFGFLRYPIAPGFFTFKRNVTDWIVGNKPSILIELGAEPWLQRPIVETSTEEQLARMNLERLNDIIAFARETSLEEQYLWGVEWWYYLKKKGRGDIWDGMKGLYAGE